MNICMSCGSPSPSSGGQCPRCGARSYQREDKLIGTTIADKYLLESKLGTGGMCEVYRARHVVIGKEVAVKILRPELAADPMIAERFEQEARAASRIRHPNAIDVNDFGVADGTTPYIVMELVDGKTVGQLLRESGQFSVERAVNILRQVCSALESAHMAGVIHRDIKPDNIMIAEYEGGDWVEVCDFGVAKIQEDVNRRAALTGANFILGTPRYMSPEQCEERPVDARSDIYSLGVVLYEMLTGEAPFEGNSTRLLVAHTFETPPLIRSKRPDLPADLEAVVMRALDKDPARRPQSAAEFFQAVERAVAGHPVKVETGSSGPFARVNVPLELGDVEPKPDASTGEIAGPDETTLVRKRPQEDEEFDSHPETLRDLSEVDPYKTIPGVTSTGSVAAPDGLEDQSRQTEIVEQARATQAGSDPAKADTGARTRSGLIRAMVATAVVVAVIVAVLVFTSRPTRSTSTPASTPATPAQQPQAQTPQEAPPPPLKDDGIDITPESVEAVQSPEQVAADPPDPPEPVVSSPKINVKAIQREVVSTLSGWTSALERRSLEGHLRYFAPSLHTFYLKRNVNRDYVRDDIARALATYSDINFQFSNISVKPDQTGKRAVATFTKAWDFKGQQSISGSVQERVWLEKVSGRWLITGVRDLKINYRRSE